MSFKVKSTETFEEECDEAYEIAEKEMIEHYGVSKIEDLNAEQLDEIYLYSEEEECDEWIGVALRSLVQQVEG
jgi:hypothetical protein